MSYQGKQQAVTAWARACPGAGENLVERVVDTAGTVTIYPIVSDTLISDYIDGHELRSYSFQLACRSTDPQRQLEIWADWILTQTETRTYPAWVNAAIDDIRPIWNAPQVNVTESNEQETVCILAASIDYIQ